MNMAAPGWNFIECSATQLCLNTVLVCGQSFRWRQNGYGEWIGVMAGHVWRLKQTDGKIQYKVYSSACKGQNIQNTDDSKSCAEASELEPTDKSLIPLVECKPQIKLLSEHEGSSGIKSKRAGTVAKVGAVPYKTSRLTLKSYGPSTQTEKHTRAQNGQEHKPDANYFSNILLDYFQLGVDLDAMYRTWSEKDVHFSEVASHFKGIRMLRQDPVENLLSFVCSSNNHISRISSMVEKLCIHYGNYIATVDGEKYHGFPSLSALCGDEVESHLRELGFGYRAKFIASIAKHVTHEKGGDDWVRSLRGRSYAEAKSELMSLLGVGAKVADCVCLMSLDHPGAIPVDTHVWQITLKHYLAKLNTAKSLTDKIYNEIGEFYRGLWGPYAGWAHSVLFTADLRQNKEKAALVDKNSKSKPAEKSEGKVSPGKRPSSTEEESSHKTKSSKISKTRKKKSK